MSKILAVFGATGQQGSSVIEHVLQDPELSQEYTIRAITRDVNSAQAQKLKDRVQTVKGDVLDRASLETALTGVHTVFSMTTPSFAPDGLEFEYSNGKAIADVALQQGAEYIVFSTLPSVKKISGGKYTKVTHFEAKVKVEQYIRGLPIQSAFLSPGFFMQNFNSLPIVAPQPASDGTWTMARHNPPSARMPMIDAIGDIGKFVGAILAEPEQYKGKTFCAAAASYSMEEVAASMSRATGKTVVYKQIPLEEWVSSLPFGQDALGQVFSYPEEYGYYGAESEQLVAWAIENARGRPSTFDEYLHAHPLQLAQKGTTA